MILELNFTYKEMRDYLRSHGYRTIRLNTWNSDIDERDPNTRNFDRIVEVECAIPSEFNGRIDTSVGSRTLYNRYSLEVQFMREMKTKLLSL